MQIENFDAYHRVYGGVSDLSRVGDRFSAGLKVLSLPRLVLHERHIEGVLQNRTRACVVRHGFDHITLHLLRGGDLVSGPPGAERRLQPGQITVLDTSRPHVSQMMARADVVSVQLARAHVREVLPDLTAVHGAILSADASRVLAEFLGSLTRRSETLPADPMASLASAAIHLLGLALNDLPASARALPAEAGDALRRRRADAFIAGHLSDPNLDADAIGAAIGISRSVLYRIFNVDGGVRRYIQQRRLNGLRRALLDPGEGRRLSSLAHAYGFTTQSHFSRSFATAFGLPPGQFRTELQRRWNDADARASREENLIDLARALY